MPCSTASGRLALATVPSRFPWTNAASVALCAAVAYVVVPLLPPGLLGYHHCGRGYYIAKDGRVGALPPARRRNSVRDMRVVLDRLVQAINEPDGARNDLTDHAALNYVSSLR